MVVEHVASDKADVSVACMEAVYDGLLVASPRVIAGVKFFYKNEGKTAWMWGKASVEGRTGGVGDRVSGLDRSPFIAAASSGMRSHLLFLTGFAFGVCSGVRSSPSSRLSSVSDSLPSWSLTRLLICLRGSMLPRQHLSGLGV